MTPPEKKHNGRKLVKLKPVKKKPKRKKRITFLFAGSPTLFALLLFQICKKNNNNIIAKKLFLFQLVTMS